MLGNYGRNKNEYVLNVVKTSLPRIAGEFIIWKVILKEVRPIYPIRFFLISNAILMVSGTDQSTLISSGNIAIYNRSTFSRNDYFPGVLISASEVNFLLSAYYLAAENSGTAKSISKMG